LGHLVLLRVAALLPWPGWGLLAALQQQQLEKTAAAARA
jgi:hypothetical protein